MQHIDWRNDLGTGHEGVDDDHRHSYAFTRAVLEAIDDAKTVHAFALLVDHLRVHFEDEETLMVSQNYVGLAHHRNEHRNQLRQLDELLKSGNAQAMRRAAMMSIPAWLDGHIRHMDKPAIEAILGRG